MGAGFHVPTESYVQSRLELAESSNRSEELSRDRFAEFAQPLPDSEREA
jgi:hypothetical protein